MTHIAIDFDDTIALALDQACRVEHVTPKTFIADAVKRRLASRWLTRTQRELAGAAQAAGYHSEEELLNDIS